MTKLKNTARRIPEMTRSRKVTVFTDLMHNSHNYTKHFETTGKKRENYLTKTETQPDNFQLKWQLQKKLFQKEHVI